MSTVNWIDYLYGDKAIEMEISHPRIKCKTYVEVKIRKNKIVMGEVPYYCGAFSVLSFEGDLLFFKTLLSQFDDESYGQVFFSIDNEFALSLPHRKIGKFLIVEISDV